MAISVDIDSVTAPDAVAGTSPHKISDKTTKDSLTFKFTPTATGPIRAWRARLDPTNRNTGTLLGSHGMVCGTGDLCGDPSSMPLALASRTQVTEDVTFDEASEPDGDYPVQVFAISTEDGWST